MQKNTFSKDEKKMQREKLAFKAVQNKSVNRFSGNATRLEHINNRNKNKGKKG